MLFCADDSLLGKTISEKETHIEIRKESFGGKKVGKKELAGLLKKADSINIFGTECTGVALREGIAKKNDVIEIAGVRHLQVYRL